MKPARLFFDTMVLVSGTAAPYLIPYASELLQTRECETFTNEYAIKELRRALAERLGVPPHLVNAAVDDVRAAVQVVPTPSKNEFAKFERVNKPDRPIVCSAAGLRAALVTEDRQLLNEAAIYVQTFNTKNAWAALHRI